MELYKNIRYVIVMVFIFTLITYIHDRDPFTLAYLLILGFVGIIIHVILLKRIGTIEEIH